MGLSFSNFLGTNLEEALERRFPPLERLFDPETPVILYPAGRLSLAAVGFPPSPVLQCLNTSGVDAQCVSGGQQEGETLPIISVGEYAAGLVTRHRPVLTVPPYHYRKTSGKSPT